VPLGDIYSELPKLGSLTAFGVTEILSVRAGQSTSTAWPELFGGCFKAAVVEMLRQGFTPAEIGKIGGGNFCRVLDKATTGHA
jgi:hypothetical protein